MVCGASDVEQPCKYGRCAGWGCVDRRFEGSRELFILEVHINRLEIFLTRLSVWVMEVLICITYYSISGISSITWITCTQKLFHEVVKNYQHRIILSSILRMLIIILFIESFKACMNCQRTGNLLYCMSN